MEFFFLLMCEILLIFFFLGLIFIFFGEIIFDKCCFFIVGNVCKVLVFNISFFLCESLFGCFMGVILL